MHIEKAFGRRPEQLLVKVQPHELIALRREIRGRFVRFKLEQRLDAVILNIEQITEFALGVG